MRFEPLMGGGRRNHVRAHVQNRFGLTRAIPTDVRRRVRRHCGFGCVLCGDAVVTYEHFDPPFRDAKQHSASGITLLCGTHQVASSKGLLSPESIADANRRPYCHQRGHASHLLDLGRTKPVLTLGGSNVTDCGWGVSFQGQWMLRLREPEPHSRRWRLSARFVGQSGATLCEIRDNELVIPAASFEVEQVGSKLHVRSAGTDLLELEFFPPGGLAINQYRFHTPEGEVFIGKRRLPDPLAGTESDQSVLEFRHASGDMQTFVNCAFQGELGLDLSLKQGSLVIQNQQAVA
jgi:hypothetical protein